MLVKLTSLSNYFVQSLNDFVIFVVFNFVGTSAEVWNLRPSRNMTRRQVRLCSTLVPIIMVFLLLIMKILYSITLFGSCYT